MQRWADRQKQACRQIDGGRQIGAEVGRPIQRQRDTDGGTQADEDKKMADRQTQTDRQM